MSIAAEANPELANNVLVARQPIYNQNMGVYAYELLFCQQNKSLHNIGQDNATAHVIVNTFLTMGLENLVSKRLATIKVSEWFLHKAKDLPIPQTKIVLEIPNSLTVTQETADTIKHLKSLGFTIAIHDFRYRKDWLPILPIIDIVKIDAHKIDNKTLPKFIKQFRKFKNLALLSSRVKSIREFSYYSEVGFDYCQGCLLSKPRIYSAKSLASSKLVILNLLSVLYKSDFSFKEAEAVISRDVSISYKLLKLINSAFFGLTNEIDSIERALVLLGRDQLRSWISVLALSETDDCAESLLEIAVIRAKMCEFLAEHSGQTGCDSYFTVGLFSALDVLMKQPLDTLLSNLPLSDEIKTAILNKQGLMGQALQCVLAHEQSDWDNVAFQNLPKTDISKIGFQAFMWTSGLLNQL